MAVTPKKLKIEKFEKILFRYKLNKHSCQISSFQVKQFRLQRTHTHTHTHTHTCFGDFIRSAHGSYIGWPPHFVVLFSIYLILIPQTKQNTFNSACGYICKMFYRLKLFLCEYIFLLTMTGLRVRKLCKLCKLRLLVRCVTTFGGQVSG